VIGLVRIHRAPDHPQIIETHHPLAIRLAARERWGDEQREQTNRSNKGAHFDPCESALAV